MVKTWTFTAVDPGFIPGQGSKIPQAVQCHTHTHTRGSTLLSHCLVVHPHFLAPDLSVFALSSLQNSLRR